MRVNLIPMLRSCALLLRSPILSGKCLRYFSAPVAQFPDSSQTRMLQLVDHFQSKSNPNGQLSKALESFRTWASENKEPPNPKVLELLFTMCFRSGHHGDVDIALAYAEAHGLKLSEGQINALITSVSKLGNYTRTKEIYQKMEATRIKIRLSALCALLQQAASERDFSFLLVLSRQLSKYKNSLPDLKVVEETLKKVFEACTDAKDDAAFEVSCILVDTFRITRQKLSREVAAVFSSWCNSFPQYSVQETTVNHSGVCSGCGLTLETGDISLDELKVLRQHIDTTLQDSIRGSANVEAEQRKIDTLNQIIRKYNFGAILDGLNIAHVFQRHSPSRKQLLQVASEAANITGKPVLALMRKHCSRWFTTTSDPSMSMAEIGKTYEHLGLHCFFTNNFDEDDLYLLYATLFSEPSTFLVTNDLQGCNKHRLPVGCHDTFQQWLRRRLANIIRVGGSIKIKFPLVYDDTVQWSPSYKVGDGPSWEYLHTPLNYRRRWLCVSQKLKCNDSQQYNSTQQLHRL